MPIRLSRLPIARLLCWATRPTRLVLKKAHICAREQHTAPPLAPSSTIPPKRTPLKREKALLTLEEVPEFVQDHAGTWTSLKRVQKRLNDHGIPSKHANILLKDFARAAENGHVGERMNRYGLNRFTDVYDDSRDEHLDSCFTLVFYSWACTASRIQKLANWTSERTMTTLQDLFKATDLRNIAQNYPLARSMKRKVIMHVGPTNSGKTHRALAALAAAPSGIFAGPLRLLAAEIWERLNLGQIVPVGQKADPENPMKFARACNLFTGEEQKIVSGSATLSSATVEMISTTRMYDVAIVDEIQMIGDPNRGGAWTNAVLGLPARELHLCGEETSVHLIKELMSITGDELIVNRYERLTPLVPERESLKGDYSKVRAGDCIVAFSRKAIYTHKRYVESLTKHRCAVAYGRLPPEIRSEQAALFNDPKSGYDVMIGSDAIGMGLNLKIKRTILASMEKYNGTESVPLSLSQAKQISGRAGRYGLHGDSDAGGTTTTLFDDGHPALLAALQATVPPLDYARITPPLSTFEAVARALPQNSSMAVLMEALSMLARTTGSCRLPDYVRERKTCREIDMHARDLTLTDRVQMMSAPIPWTDTDAMPLITKMMNLYSRTMCVRLHEVLSESGYTPGLTAIEEDMELEKGESKKMHDAMVMLESFHKVLEVYGWFAFRNVVAYPDAEECRLVLERVDRAMDFALEGMTMPTKVTKPKEVEEADTVIGGGGPGRPAYVVKSWKEKREEGGSKGKKAFDWQSRSEYMRSTAGGSGERVTV